MMEAAEIRALLRDNCKTCTREALPGSDFCDWCEDVKCPVCAEPMGAIPTRMCADCQAESTVFCACGTRYTFDQARREAQYFHREKYGDYWCVCHECPKCLGVLELWTDMDGEAAPQAVEHLLSKLMSRHRKQMNYLQLEDAINER